MHCSLSAFPIYCSTCMERKRRRRFELLTSSIVAGTSVKFLPTHATVSLVPSQLHALGHLPACAGKASENISRKDTAEMKCICTSKQVGKHVMTMKAMTENMWSGCCVLLLLHEAISRLRRTLCLCNDCLYELQVVSHVDL